MSASAIADFYRQLAELEEEREAAYLTRKDGDEGAERWKKAKHAYEEFRSAMRLFREAEDKRRQEEGGDGSAPITEDASTARPSTVTGSTTVHEAGGSN